MIKKILTLAILLLPVAGFPLTDRQLYHATIQNNSGNPVIFLDQNWQLIIDEDESAGKYNLPVFLDENVSAVVLRNEFEIPDSLSELNLKLHFSGIQGFAEVSLNKILITTHPDFPSPFSVEIQSNWLKNAGKNILEIRISRPTEKSQGFPSYAYIFSEKRDLALTGNVYIEWLPRVRYKKFAFDFKNNKLNFSYQLRINRSDTLRNGAYNKLRFEEKVLNSDGKEVFRRFEYINYMRQNRNINRSVELSAPVFWSPGQPELYELDLRAYADGKLIVFSRNKFGLRSLTVSRGHIQLNGKPFQLKGVVYRKSKIKTSSEVYADFETIKKDFLIIKNMGFNTVRIPNSSIHPAILNLCDTLGLMVCLENGIWRLPQKHFTEDYLLQMAKQVAREITDENSLHPSLFALGLGNEIPIQVPAVQKFILILSKYIKQNNDILTYFSPLDYTQLPGSDLTDIYFISAYNNAVFSVLDFINKTNRLYPAALILSNVGFPAGIDSVANKFSYFNSRYQPDKNFSGFFIESFRDWPAENTDYFSSEADAYPYGIFTLDGQIRTHDLEINRIVFGKPSTGYVHSSTVSKKSNFFSLSIFFTSILFFLIYRRNFRLRDNIKRSLSHSYGFFVDLRDRRIIALFNSFIIGLFSNLLVANILAAYLYYFRDSVYVEEIVSATLVPLGLNGFYINLVQYPFLLLMVIWGLFFCGQIMIAGILKLLNIFSDEKIRFRQTVAVCNWAGVPLLFLIPVSLVAYQIIIPREYLHLYLLMALILFFIWYNYRLANGIRVLMILQAYKVFSILVLTYCILFFILLAFLESQSDYFDYINLLARGKSLFY